MRKENQKILVLYYIVAENGNSALKIYTEKYIYIYITKNLQNLKGLCCTNLQYFINKIKSKQSRLLLGRLLFKKVKTVCHPLGKIKAK